MFLRIVWISLLLFCNTKISHAETRSYSTYVAAASITTIASLWAYHSAATYLEAKNYKPRGKLVNIDSKRKIHYLEEGTEHSGPTVVLVHGVWSSHLDWYLVSREVSKFARVISYDGAGFGWSDSSTSIATPKNNAVDLLKLLKAAKVPGPYILVGHSFGGLISRAFTSLAPKLVKSVILVDSVHQDFYDGIYEKKTTQKEFEKLARMFHWSPLFSKMSGFRILTLLIQKMNKFPEWIKDYPEDLLNIYLMFFVSTNTYDATLRLLKYSKKSCAQIKAMPNKLINKPLTVIAAGKFEGPKESSERFFQMQKDLCNLSNNSKFLVAENSGHSIHHEQPDIIIDEIIKMLGLEHVTNQSQEPLPQ
jgi:pimeloyl-ACP methyl ester carboxylesterase